MNIVWMLLAFLETLRLSVAMAADVSFETVELQLAAIDAAETSTTHDEQQNVLASIPVSGLAVTVRASCYSINTSISMPNVYVAARGLVD